MVDFHGEGLNPFIHHDDFPLIGRRASRLLFDHRRVFLLGHRIFGVHRRCRNQCRTEQANPHLFVHKPIISVFNRLIFQKTWDSCVFFSAKPGKKARCFQAQYPSACSPRVREQLPSQEFLDRSSWFGGDGRKSRGGTGYWPGGRGFPEHQWENTEPATGELNGTLNRNRPDCLRT